MEKIVINEKKNFKQIGSIVTGSIVGGIIGSVVTYSLITTGTTQTTVKGGASEYKIEEVNNPVEAIAESVSPSVVGIKVKFMEASFFGSFTEAEGEGSGIAYNSDGYIITNYHVVSDAINNSQATVSVYLNGDSESAYEAEVIGGDEFTDLAVIKIDPTKAKLTPAKIGKSADVKVGSLAVAIGNPLGLEFAGTVTGGYISGVDRKITTDGRTHSLIQTDAAINAGNSGGALVNASGEIIGINTAKIGATGVEGIGFAIPVDTAKPIIDELIKNKKVVRPYIGIGGINIDKVTSEKYKYPVGIYVQTVEKSSPAELAGIQAGDIIIKAEGEKVSTMEEINDMKYEKSVGDKFKITVYRNKKEVELTIVLGED